MQKILLPLTGHKDRLDRTLINRFGTPEYAREELRAEISSLILGGELGIGHDFGQHAAYVSSWIQVLKEDPFEIHRASAEAQKISDYLLAFEQKIELKKNIPLPAANTWELNEGEVITYKAEEFKVLEKKSGVFLMERLSNGSRFRLSANDKLYSSLLSAKAEVLPQTAAIEIPKESKSIKR